MAIQKVKCSVCKGEGFIYMRIRGKAFKVREKCYKCNGKGTVEEEVFGSLMDKKGV